MRKKFCFCFIFFSLDRNPFLQSHSFIFIAAWRTLLKLNKLGKNCDKSTSICWAKSSQYFHFYISVLKNKSVNSTINWTNGQKWRSLSICKFVWLNEQNNEWSLSFAASFSFGRITTCSRTPPGQPPFHLFSLPFTTNLSVQKSKK